ncbi:MAG: peptide chain release factor N(5)-glutamine methyltransferase [Chitinivibrionales bacterium]|nr:peptide chain release factor N(5)-glutamine methyltransferase [Chitinivibrionales bacterium]
MLTEIADHIAPHCPETPRLDAEVLLAEVLGTDKAGLYRSFHDLVPVFARNRLRELVQRRIKKEPISYILGRKEFWSLVFSVGPDVMVPRPDTEVLVEEALRAVPLETRCSILDIGTGSGAIAVALAKERPAAIITATDISASALETAKRNAALNHVTAITFRHGDLFDPVRDREHNFDLIVSNPPYIPTDETSRLPKGLRDYEPYSAFDGGPDGLALYRRIIREAPRYLKADGILMVEVGYDQSTAVSNLIREAGGFRPPETVRDLSGLERVVKAQMERL